MLPQPKLSHKIRLEEIRVQMLPTRKTEILIPVRIKLSEVLDYLGLKQYLWIPVYRLAKPVYFAVFHFAANAKCREQCLLLFLKA